MHASWAKFLKTNSIYLDVDFITEIQLIVRFSKGTCAFKLICGDVNSTSIIKREIYPYVLLRHYRVSSR